ncbi:MAG: hypothetical protein EA351_05265 [Gemmatimonadales bacterium]|nr:MAG: hypothetical protein EA351_05265 [Gemmatimonadales bacterium]
MATTPRPSSSSFSPGPRRRHLSVVTLLSLFLVASCSDVVGPDGDPAADHDEWIVFVSDRVSEEGEEVVDIFRMNPDGSDVQNLTSHPTRFYTDLGLSPDHSTLLFRSTRSGCDVWSLAMESLEALQITGPGEGCSTRPRWSPDGSMIGFTSSRNGRWEVYAMEADGSAPRNVSNYAVVEDLVSSFMHRWTPDGRLTFFHSRGNPGVPSTHVVNPDGSGLELLFEDFDSWYIPHWSPDGSRMSAYLPIDGDGDWHLHLMNGDGTEATVVSGEEGSLMAGSGTRPLDPWSPDGERLVASGHDGLYVMNADGSGLTQVVPFEGRTNFDGWSPGGTRIAFSSDQAGTWDVYVVNIDGTGLQRITDDSGNDRNAVWVSRR